MEYVTRQFINLAKKLHELFKSLHENVEKISRSVESATADYHSEKQRTANNEPVLVELRRQQSEIDEQKTRETNKEQRESRQESRDRVRLRFELGGLIIGVILALAGVGSLIISLISASAARDAANAAQQSAIASKAQVEATKSSIEATINQFRLEQRAWVGMTKQKITSFNPGEPIGIEITFFNSGKTPAKHVRVRSLVIWSPVAIAGPNEKQIRKLQLGKLRSAPSIAPQSEWRVALGKTFAVGEVTTPEGNVGAQEITNRYELIRSGKLILYSIGEVVYDDTSGEKDHITQFCIYMSDPIKKDIGVCPEFNDIY